MTVWDGKIFMYVNHCYKQVKSYHMDNDKEVDLRLFHVILFNLMKLIVWESPNDESLSICPH